MSLPFPKYTIGALDLIKKKINEHLQRITSTLNNFNTTW